jgi:hypothetical protein
MVLSLLPQEMELLPVRPALLPQLVEYGSDDP